MAANHIASLTECLESRNLDPWSLQDADQPFIENTPNYIKGLEISINEMQGKFQASQQYSENTRNAIKEGLVKERGDFGKSVYKMIADRNDKNC